MSDTRAKWLEARLLVPLLIAVSIGLMLAGGIGSFRTHFEREEARARLQESIHAYHEREFRYGDYERLGYIHSLLHRAKQAGLEEEARDIERLVEGLSVEVQQHHHQRLLD